MRKKLSFLVSYRFNIFIKKVIDGYIKTYEKIAVLKHNLAKDKAVKELLAIVTDYQLKQ